MIIKSNIAELIKKYQALAAAIAQADFSEALTVGINAGMAAMKFRIFNEGLDKQKNSLGKYQGKKSRITNRRFHSNTEGVADAAVKKLAKKALKKLRKNADETGESDFSEYEKIRLADGRQIGYKDLEFTGGMRRSIIVAADGNTKVVCTFNNNELAKIAEYQEIQIGTIRGGQRVPIFGANEDEQAIIKENTNAALKQIYDRLFNN